MKEIGPIPRKLWPFESTPGHPRQEWGNAQLNEFGNGSEWEEINNNIGGSGESRSTVCYSGGAGYKTKNDPTCFQDGLKGGLKVDRGRKG